MLYNILTNKELIIKRSTNMNNHNDLLIADDDYESVGTLFKFRMPSLIVGLFLGISISFVTSEFKEVLIRDIEIAFFMPFIVYIADAIGEQTVTIYSRALKTGKAKFGKYLWKELSLGLIFGIIFGLSSGAISFLWLKNELLALSVAIATCLAIIVSPIVALLVTHAFQTLHDDPAAYSSPIATVLQDMTSILIYGIVCSMIIL